jgi:hypothetical protein
MGKASKPRGLASGRPSLRTERHSYFHSLGSVDMRFMDAGTEQHPARSFSGVRLKWSWCHLTHEPQNLLIWISAKRIAGREFQQSNRPGMDSRSRTPVQKCLRTESPRQN